jgi:lipopolysaccharide transport system ATP-binding protein
MATIESLCERCVLLSRGAIESGGQPQKVINRYLENNSEASTTAGKWDRRTELVRDKTGYLCMQLEEPAPRFAISGKPLTIRLKFQVGQIVPNGFAIGVYSQSNLKLLHLDSIFSREDIEISEGAREVICTIPRLPLPPGSYYINLSMRSLHERIERIERAALLVVEPGDFFGKGKLPAVSESLFLADQVWQSK